MWNQQLTEEPATAPSQLCLRCKSKSKRKGRGQKFCEDCAAYKLCTKCGLNERVSDGFRWCRECGNKQQLAYRARCIEAGLCVDCGVTPHRPNRRTCQECEAKRKPNRKTIRQTYKASAVAYLGGACKDCGLTSEWLDVYDFHHRDPHEKELTLGRAFRKDWELLKSELDKCDLICANCHRIRHAKMGGTQPWRNT
jgi:hypothetical protein